LKNKKYMKTKDILIDIIVITIIISCMWASLMNDMCCGGAKYFFVTSVIEDFKSTLRDVVKEEVIWRFLPLLSISYILSLIKYESRKKKIALCIISFIIILLIQIQFGFIHYNPVYEDECWRMRHIIWQGTMGLFYAISYNIIQYYLKRQGNKLIQSHIIAFCGSFIIHLLTDIVLIASLTF